jgi:hypothetical protein
MKVLIFIVLLLSLSLCACKATGKDFHTSETSLTASNTKGLFLFFKAKSFQKKTKIELVKQQTTSSKIKGVFNQQIPINNLNKNHWLLSFNNGEDLVLQIQISNPFMQQIESVDQNGAFISHQIIHDKTTFMVRIPIDKKINNVVFENIEDSFPKSKLMYLDQINF